MHQRGAAALCLFSLLVAATASATEPTPIQPVTAAAGAPAPAPPGATTSPAPPALSPLPPPSSYPPPIPYPAPGNAYPPPIPYPAPGYAYPYPPPASPYGGSFPQSLYEDQRRSPGLALALEFLVPGVGSIYGDHVAGALLGWGAMILGVVLIVDGLDLRYDCSPGDSYPRSSDNRHEVSAGILLLLGGRIYGLVDAYSSTVDYNERLLQQLSLPGRVAVGLQPLRAPGSMAYAPTVRVRF